MAHDRANTVIMDSFRVLPGFFIKIIKIILTKINLKVFFFSILENTVFRPPIRRIPLINVVRCPIHNKDVI